MTNRILTVILLLMALTLCACARGKDTVAGTYAAKNGDTEIVLNLKENGTGTWSTDLDEIRFKWSVRKDGRLWLHTREGGVIQGRIADESITLALPGVPDLLFTRQ
jgi:hypothetical protein